MFQTIRHKLMLMRNCDYDAVLCGDVPTRPDRQEALEAKRAAAKKYLGRKWILHPANQAQRATDLVMHDSATAERQRFIRAVK